MLAMDTKEKAKIVGAAIKRARKQRGLVMRQLAEHLGVHVAAIGNYESGKNLPSTENLIALSDFLRVDQGALSRGEVVSLTDEPLADAERVTDPAPPPSGPLDIEVLGTTAGGDDGDFRFNGERQGFVRRPPGLAGVVKAFALHTISDSMVPRYFPGELIYVGGREPVPGDHIVIELFPENEGEVGKSYIKYFVRRTASEIIVSQYNPPKELTFNRYAVKALWRVIPLAELLGY
ncbi:helix-turn-helix protein [Sinorhizobium sp. KGO-5]|uniref:XRE family transcriptional regulator n=1 Tax=Sinorhizobium sp. KGO-5 TaxID=1470810 RepID=UPI00294967EA|nr:helix-turn-helix protein [Sinorhizobium sp. KGO-5]